MAWQNSRLAALATVGAVLVAACGYSYVWGVQNRVDLSRKIRSGAPLRASLARVLDARDHTARIACDGVEYEVVFLDHLPRKGDQYSLIATWQHGQLAVERWKGRRARFLKIGASLGAALVAGFLLIRTFRVTPAGIAAKVTGAGRANRA